MKAKLLLIGGFLGAGKTTSILRFTQELMRRRLKVAIITNDQASGLVDSALARGTALTVDEIAGGCFCCRADDLEKKLRNLEKNSSPDVIIAEPVGSCTDLIATVVKPLKSVYKTGLEIAPFSVVLDPFNMLRTLHIEPGNGFAPEIEYIVGKQMEEAEVLVINKMDIVSEARLSKLKHVLAERFPKARICSVSARTGKGCQEWFDLLMHEVPAYLPLIDVDYQKYAIGEELLGWYNGTMNITIRSSKGVATL